MANILRKIIENDKGEIKKLEKTAKKVESYAVAMAALSDEELQAKTEEFKQRYGKSPRTRFAPSRTTANASGKS